MYVFNSTTGFSRLLSALIGTLLLSGCSGIKTYPNQLAKNLTVQTKTSSDSILRDVEAYLHIYSVDKKCQTDYLGTVDLDKPKIAVGLPVNQLIYVDFVFVKSGFFSSTTSSISSATLLQLKKGRQYQANASYENNIYNTEIVELKSKGGKPRELPAIPLQACNKFKP